MELTKHGNNANIKIDVLSDEKMRDIGFTDLAKTTWYYYENIGYDISFNLSVVKNDPTDWRIDVLDDSFCQPYDYQYLLTLNDHPIFAEDCNRKVEKIMIRLTDVGIVNGWKPGDYI